MPKMITFTFIFLLTLYPIAELTRLIVAYGLYPLQTFELAAMWLMYVVALALVKHQIVGLASP